MANPNISEKHENALVWSYLGVRRAVGLLGFFLPVMLVVLSWTLPVRFMPSISEFYFTPVREALVATIGAISVFLFSYKGYSPHPKRAEADWKERWLSDRNVSYAAAAGALGVALFPMNSAIALDPLPLAIQWLGLGTSGIVHNVSALTFFVALSVFCLVNFQRTDPDKTIEARRDAENRVYARCGWVLVAATVALIAITVIDKFAGWPDASQWFLDVRAVFVVETIGLFAFAVSWLVKGKTLTPVVTMMTRQP